MTQRRRTWDVPYDGPADEDDDEFRRPGFDEDGLDEFRAYKYDASGQLRALNLAEGEAGLEDYLVDRWLKGSLTAREVCTIAYWATAAGASGFVRTLSFRPDAPTGHFSRHLRTVLRMDVLEANQSTIDVPCYSKAEFDRSVMALPCMPLFESLGREVAATPNMASRLADMVSSDSLPPVVTEHTVFETSGQLAQPCVLYVDAVPTTKKDSLLGFWVHTVVTGKRHLCVVIRKSRFCQCGCRGWCSIWPVMMWLQWCFLSLAAGTYPDRMWNGREWSDLGRKEKAGKPLGFFACLVATTGDWAEYAHTFAMPNWRSNVAPCPHCVCTRANFFEDDDLSPLDGVWPALSAEEYDRLVAECEIHVVLNSEAHRKIRNCLVYDSSKTGFHGRVLCSDLPEYNLLANDRLEPSFAIMDTGSGFDNMTQFPVVATFWRTSCETRAKHRNPLYNPAIGISVQLFLVDMLHCFYLGLLQTFSCALVWEMIICNCWNVTVHRNWDDLVTMSYRLLAVELNSFYDKWHRDGGKELTTVQQFLPTMIGTRDQRCLRLKAAETKGFFCFCATRFNVVVTVWAGPTFGSWPPLVWRAS